MEDILRCAIVTGNYGRPLLGDRAIPIEYVEYELKHCVFCTQLMCIMGFIIADDLFVFPYLV